ncbi:MAG TPA: hypothetical protein PLN96_05255 [Zoogloea sp.]|uniref:hypothetical protein n=1 Tax=Zoogloea sp. TaxID=49181 RepID=UPI002C84366E|nr:hypothetical protein [Zoogloea sp.]HNA67254.1 hypothetical protein [Rhodocyclaceae bacterium]HNI47244.1 hypothetical protein [Zoogloea sp.]
MTQHLAQRDLDALRQPIPLHQLLPLAGLERLTLDQLNHAATLNLDLQRRVLARLKAGELCLVPAWRASAYGMPMLDIPAFFRRHAADSANLETTA